MSALDDIDMTLCNIWRELKEIHQLTKHTLELPEETASILREIECVAGAAAWKIEADAGCRREAAE